jgi:ABC-2 type transport system ATP-binding protein
VPAPAIATQRLTKDYGLARGLFDLDLEVRPGEVFGFLGPNGAGKSTTIRLLMDLIRPDRGGARIFDLDTRAASVAVKRLIGYTPGELPDYPAFTGAQVVDLLAHLRGGVPAAQIRALAERFRLDLSHRYAEYSHGQKQLVALVQAFMHRPALLILDEPTSGLDPLNQQEFHRLIAEVRSEGRTVFLSSHVLSEVEQVCDRVGIIRAGRLVRVGALDEIRGIRIRRVEVTFDGTLEADRLAHLPGVSEVELADHRLRCNVRGGFAPLLAVLAGAQVRDFSSHEPSLEEAFLTYFGGPSAAS